MKKLAYLFLVCTATMCSGCKLVDFVDRAAVQSWLTTVVNDSGLCAYVCSMCDTAGAEE